MSERISETAGPVFNGSELFELLFSVFKGDLPDELTDEKIAELADAIASAFPGVNATLAPAVPPDVAELVISAREVAYSDIQDAVRAYCPDMMQYMDALDRAAEAFADRVPWEDDPDEEAALAAAEVTA